MQKFSDPCIKTGDFAKLCNTNKRTLFHYDEIGLFSPARTDSKGYRYYSETQCDTFLTISCLKELGMPLKEIKNYLDHRSPETLQTLLLEQEDKVRTEILRLNKIRQIIDTKLSLVNAGLQVRHEQDSDTVFAEDVPEEYLIISEPLNSCSHDLIIRTLYDHIGYCSRHGLNSGHPYGAMQDFSELSKKHWDTYAFFFTKVIDYPEGHPFHIKPAGTYAATYLKGNYYDSQAAYERLFTWIREHGFTVGGYFYKEAVIDEIASAQQEEYLTKISVPVCRARK